MHTPTHTLTHKLLAPPALVQPLWADDVFDHGHGGEELDGASHFTSQQVSDFRTAVGYFTT